MSCNDLMVDATFLDFQSVTNPFGIDLNRFLAMFCLMLSQQCAIFFQLFNNIKLPVVLVYIRVMISHQLYIGVRSVEITG